MIPPTITTTGSSNTATEYVYIEPPEPPPASHLYTSEKLFDAFLNGLDELVLVPKSALGAAILNRWLGFDIKSSIMFVGEMDSGLKEFRLRFESKPGLTPGGQSEYSGRVTVSPDEQKMLRETLDAHRTTKALQARRKNRKGKAQ